MTEGDEGGAGRLQVCFLPLSHSGRLGFTVLPGRRGRDDEGRFWTRDLDEDLERLSALRVDRIVLLVSDVELTAARSRRLPEAASARGLALVHHPLPPQVGAEQRDEIRRLLDALGRWLAEGSTVVLVSGDGLGRAPLVAGTYLLRVGTPASRAVKLLRKLRGPECLRSSDAALLEAWETEPSPPETESAPRRTAGAGHIARAYSGSSSPRAADPEPGDPPWAREAREDLEETESEPAAPTPPPARVAARTAEAPSPMRWGGGDRADRSFTALTPVESSCVGALLGTALGDALGAPLEPETRRAQLEARYGPKGPEAPALSAPPGRPGPECAVPSDETQLVLVAVQTVVESRLRRLEVDTTLSRLAERIGRWTRERRGPWSPETSTLEVAEKIRDGSSWAEAATNAEQGSSGLVRAVAFGLAFADDLARAEQWAAAQCRVTHRSPEAVGAAAALAAVMARFGRGDRPEVALSEGLAAACRHSPRLAGRLARALDDADSGVPPAVFFERHSEATARDTLATAYFVLRRHPDDLESALREGVMTPGDSDAVGAVLGATLGARLGASALPPSWVQVLDDRENLEGLALALAASR
ncbi:MAG: ADP-ribosylglycohydrolase family protein [Myxococcota bacterium]